MKIHVRIFSWWIALRTIGSFLFVLIGIYFMIIGIGKPELYITIHFLFGILLLIAGTAGISFAHTKKQWFTKEHIYENEDFRQ